MRKLLLALALLCFATPALAQNTQCSNRPAGDSSNACANTRFVAAAVAAVPLAGFVTCPANQFVNVVAAASLCAQPSFSNLSGQATLAQLPTIGANTVLGSIAGGTPIALTQTQLTSLINAFTSGLSGAVPASGGGTTNFLRADGTFAAPAGGSTALPRGYISGYTHSNDVSSPNTVLDFTVGTARDSTNAQNITIASAFTKTTAAWAVGTGNGCFETGTTIANNTFYYTYAILRTDLASADYVCSLSPSSPNLTGGGLTSYSFFRRIGSFKTATASTNILAFTQVNDHWYWTAAIRETGGLITCATSPTLTAALTVPKVQGTVIIFNSLYFGTPGSGEGVLFAPGFSPAVSIAADGYSMIQNVTNVGAAGQYNIPVDSAGKISFICDTTAAGIVFNIYTKGWIDIL